MHVILVGVIETIRQSDRFSIFQCLPEEACSLKMCLFANYKLLEGQFEGQLTC